MKRFLYQKLLDWKHQKVVGPIFRKPLIVEGARQVGKTHLIKEFGTKEFPVCHYINFEQEEKLSRVFETDLKPQRILKELEFHFQRPIHPATDLLVFDEIQMAPKALTSLKYFHEEMPELALCCAGSLLGVALSEVSFPVGKVDFLSLHPLSLAEFLMAKEDHYSLEFLQNFKEGDGIPENVHERLWASLKEYFVVGGLPEAVQAYVTNRSSPFQAMESVRQIQNHLIFTYMADMAKHSGRQNSMHLERLLRHIPEQLAKNQDQSAKKFRFSGAIPGVEGYQRLSGTIDWLEKARLILRVPIVNHAALPLSAYVKENTFKLYMFDVGLLGALSGLNPKTLLEYDYGSYKGYFAENYVAQEFCAGGDVRLYSWNEKTAEIEFLKEVDGNIIPVEVKSGWVSQAKSLRVYSEKYVPPYSIILSAKNKSISAKNRTRFYPLYLAGFIPLKG